jgi:ubiquitin C-terminal hydrolase
LENYLYPLPKKNHFEIQEKDDGPPISLNKQEEEEEEDDDFMGTGTVHMNKDNKYSDDLPNLDPVHYPTLTYFSGGSVTINNPTTSGSASCYSSQISPMPTQDNSKQQQQQQIEFGCVNNPELCSSTTLTASSNTSTYFNEYNTGYVGLINQAMTCYLNSLLQTLYMTPEFRNAIYRWKYTDDTPTNENGKRNIIPYQLQRLFVNLQTTKKKSIHTHDLTKSFGWNSDDAFQQHDVQELCRVMFDALEKTFKGTEQHNLINELYQGKVKDYVKCLECNIENARVDVFLDIPLCIRPFGSDKTYESVEEALDAFVQPEILDGNNKYYCENCKKMCKAHKGLKFQSFPYILSLQLKRFDFDYKTMSRFKLSNTVTFPEEINLKKYLNNNHDDNNNDKTNSNSNQDLTNTNANNDDIHNELLDYELFSIMIHSGSVNGGHYYGYIKCFETGEWFNFNDERVTRLDRDDIKKAFGTSYSIYSSTTAYMLLYRQKNPKRNEKFIKESEFSEHIKQLLETERKQQIEADLYKEYMDNACKIKVIVSEVALETDDNSTNTNNKRREKTINIHKDKTLEEAKEVIINEFNLKEYLDLEKYKFRILKYDSYNHHIEQSYHHNETTMTVFEALGYSKFSYNICWYFEIIPINNDFTDYNSSDLIVKIVHLNTETFDLNELFTLRLKSDYTVHMLHDEILKKLDVDIGGVKMALERLHTLQQYIYLNDKMEEKLKAQNFNRVNKVFISYESSKDDNNDESDQISKFHYALDTISNILQLNVYLPIEEQCKIYLNKKREREQFLNIQSFNENDDANCYNIQKDDQNNTVITKMNSDFETKINLVENHFKNDQKTPPSPTQSWSPMRHLSSINCDLSVDEGIGSGGSSAHNQIKSSPTLSEDKVKHSLDLYQSLINKNKTENELDFDINDNRDDINSNSNSYNDDDDDEVQLGDVVDRCDEDMAALDDIDVDVDDATQQSDNNEMYEDEFYSQNENDCLLSSRDLLNLNHNQKPADFKLNKYLNETVDKPKPRVKFLDKENDEEASPVPPPPPPPAPPMPNTLLIGKNNTNDQIASQIKVAIDENQSNNSLLMPSPITSNNNNNEITSNNSGHLQRPRYISSKVVVGEELVTRGKCIFNLFKLKSFN